MPQLKYDIKSYRPYREKVWQDNGDGSFTAHIYTREGVVEVFTFVGDDRHSAFTSLELYLACELYHARLPRHYHQRWLRRIAEEFAFQCGRLANA